MDQHLGAVQQKVPCLFKIAVNIEPSNKRYGQNYNVMATDTLNTAALSHDIYRARATEKVDGTCVYFATFEGKPWMWARHDRKPTKQAERRLRKHLSIHTRSLADRDHQYGGFHWDIDSDFRDTPEHWMPSLGVESQNGKPQPDEQGHIPGWVPVKPSSSQHRWHLSTVDLHHGLVVVLRETQGGSLEVVSQKLSDLIGCTGELIGTNINGNPYKIGSKKQPVHLVYIHGTFLLKTAPEPSLASIREWFDEGDFESGVEGIVWHCTDGKLFKLHRHHLGLRWPIDTPRLCDLTTTINIPWLPCQPDDEQTTNSEMTSAKPSTISSPHSMLRYFHLLHGVVFKSLSYVIRHDDDSSS